MNLRGQTSLWHSGWESRCAPQKGAKLCISVISVRKHEPHHSAWCRCSEQWLKGLFRRSSGTQSRSPDAEAKCKVTVYAILSKYCSGWTESFPSSYTNGRHRAWAEFPPLYHQNDPRTPPTTSSSFLWPLDLSVSEWSKFSLALMLQLAIFCLWVNVFLFGYRVLTCYIKCHLLEFYFFP